MKTVCLKIFTSVLSTSKTVRPFIPSTFTARPPDVPVLCDDGSNRRDQKSAEKMQTKASFVGYRALVLKSDIPWNAWDSTMYGALAAKGHGSGVGRRCCD